MDCRIKVIAVAVLFLFIGATLSASPEPVHYRNRNFKKPFVYPTVYRPRWVSVIKKGRLFKYKRKEFSSPRIFGEKIFVGADSGYFYAMKKKNGHKVWRFHTHGGVNSAPAFGGSFLYFGDDKGFLYSLETETGKLQWQVDLGAEILTAPAVEAGTVYATTVEGRVVALDIENGSVRWEQTHPVKAMTMTIRGNSPPVLKDASLYVGFADGTFWSLEKHTGRLLWERNFPNLGGFSDIDGEPLIDGELIYLATFDGPLVALSRKTGKTVWSVAIGSGAPFVAEGDRLYVSGSRGILYALNKRDGTKLWETKIGEGALSAPVIHQGILAVGLSSSTMNFVDCQKGTLMYRRFARKGIFSDPVLDGDFLYYFSNGGRLYSLKLH